MRIRRTQAPVPREIARLTPLSQIKWGLHRWAEVASMRIDRGEYRLVRRTPPANEGVVKWLLDCPQKGFFVPIESETTDVL